MIRAEAATPDRWRRPPIGPRLARAAIIAIASVVMAFFILAPIAWLVSSSFQTEAEIVSVPPHWIPEEPTGKNFAAIFTAGEEEVTYETRTRADPASGGYIPSTANSLLPAMANSFIVAFFVAGSKTTLPIYVFASIRRGVTPEINAIATTVLVASLFLIAVARMLLREKKTKADGE